MKKIFFALVVAAAAFSFTGCESKLDIQQKGVIAQENFYKTDEDALSALTSAYYMAGRWFSNSMQTTAGWNDCPWICMWEYASDDMFVAGENKGDGASGNEIQSFRATSNNGTIAGAYEAYYMIINACNLVICNFEALDNVTPTMQRCIAEARVIRAYTQHLLALGWGTAPIVDHILAGDERPANAESQEAVLKWVASECDTAMPYLQSKSSVSDADKSLVVTKEFAYAVKGKALISIKDYAGAKAAFKQVIDSKKYELVPSDKMETLNHSTGKATTEAVFELAYNWEGSLGNYYRSQPNFRPLWNWRSSRMVMPGGTDGNGWGWCNPSKKFVDAILDYDGYDSARRKAWIKSYDEVLYEMPYLSDSECPTLDAKKADTNRGINHGEGLYGHCGYFMWKRLFREEDKIAADGNCADWNLTIMRYAEVLLLYAECCAQTGDDGSGLAALKLVNERAQSKTPVTKCDMETVKKEKFLECWLDATRFQDLVRWGDAAKELGDGGHYYPNFADAMFTKGETEHRGYLVESDADWCLKAYPGIGFKAGVNELFPFPFTELQVNPNITQNNGYN